MIKRKCFVCKKVFYTYPCRLNGDYGHLAKYCSNKCAHKVSFDKWNKAGIKTRFKKGHIPFSKLHSEKMPHGINHHSWKGENVGYRGLHYWLHRELGNPTKCSSCGLIAKPPERRIDWASIDHKYHRNLNDYIPLCKSCHKNYDLSHKLNHRLFSGLRDH